MTQKVTGMNEDRIAGGQDVAKKTKLHMPLNKAKETRLFGYISLEAECREITKTVEIPLTKDKLKSYFFYNIDSKKPLID